jgi:hypothetical protein
MPAKTQREREAEQRQAKLDRIQEQLDQGSLTIRKMTDEERARFARQRDDRDAADPGRRRKRAARTKPRAIPPTPRTT